MVLVHVGKVRILSCDILTYYSTTRKAFYLLFYLLQLTIETIKLCLNIIFSYSVFTLINHAHYVVENVL